LRKVNPIWRQQAWCCVGHPIIKKPKTVVVTPATERYINRMGPSVSSDVATHNWEKK